MAKAVRVQPLSALAYAAANAYLDCLARARHRHGCHTVSLDWVTWQGVGFGSDAAIVRNRAKIEATLANARATVALRATGEPLQALVRAHAPRRRDRPPATWADVLATVPESVALARELKRRGFRFVGPTTLYALMQACGLVDDHLDGCPARPAVEEARRAHVDTDRPCRSYPVRAFFVN